MQLLLLLKKAKGDSFLINKIIKIKSIDDKELTSDVESMLKAEKLC